MEKVLFLCFADSFPADCMSLAVDGKTTAKCKCHKTDLVTVKLQGRAERARDEENLPSHFPNKIPDLEEADGQQIFQTRGTAKHPNVSRFFLLLFSSSSHRFPLEMHKPVTDPIMTVY